MKAIKINIKKEWVDCDRGIYREAVYESLIASIRNNESLPTEQVTIKEVTYFPMKVYEPGQLEYTTYLVKEDEQKVFRELMTIQQETLNKAVEEAVDKKWEMKHMEITARALKTIRELPWYKRLFKQF